MGAKLQVGDTVGSDDGWEIISISKAYDEFGIRPKDKPYAPGTLITFRSEETADEIRAFLTTMQVP